MKAGYSRWAPPKYVRMQERPFTRSNRIAAPLKVREPSHNWDRDLWIILQAEDLTSLIALLLDDISKREKALPKLYQSVSQKSTSALF